jgi:hypothetical protein
MASGIELAWRIVLGRCKSEKSTEDGTTGCGKEKATRSK